MQYAGGSKSCRLGPRASVRMQSRCACVSHDIGRYGPIPPSEHPCVHTISSYRAVARSVRTPGILDKCVIASKQSDYAVYSYCTRCRADGDRCCVCGGHASRDTAVCVRIARFCWCFLSESTWVHYRIGDEFSSQTNTPSLPRVPSINGAAHGGMQY